MAPVRRVAGAEGSAGVRLRPMADEADDAVQRRSLSLRRQAARGLRESPERQAEPEPPEQASTAGRAGIQAAAKPRQTPLGAPVSKLLAEGAQLSVLLPWELPPSAREVTAALRSSGLRPWANRPSAGLARTARRVEPPPESGPAGEAAPESPPQRAAEVAKRDERARLLQPRRVRQPPRVRAHPARSKQLPSFRRRNRNSFAYRCPQSQNGGESE